MSATLILTIITLGIAVFTDIKYKQIFNWLTFPMMIVGLILCGFPFHSVAYVRLAWMVGFFFFGMLGLIGLGDLKLFMAIVALRGFMETIWAIVFGGLIMIIYLLITQRTLMIQSLKGFVNSVYYRSDRIVRTGKEYPFAPFFAIGYCIAFLFLRFVF